jgi:hypothetical protein
MKATMNSQILRLTACVLLLSSLRASATVRYVNVNNAVSAPPYTNWNTAATAIQAAVEAALGMQSRWQEPKS